MPDPARTVQRTYLALTLLTTLAASFVWGINTLFLLDAGLSNTEAFAANAFFAVGQVIFEVPTGVIADTRGRYSIAGLAAALVAGAQIAGGLIVPWTRRWFRRRTDALLAGTAANVALLALIGWTDSFVIALVLLAAWAMVYAIEGPIRQAFINGCIPSQQRATVLSFDSLVGSVGGVVAQPALGRVADVYGYGPSYVVSAAVSTLALPFMWLARRERAGSDPLESGPAVTAPPA